MLSVDWRAVSYNAPSRTMPRPTPWVHGLIRDSRGPSPRIQLAPQKGGSVINLLYVAPDQLAAEELDWDAGALVTVDGHEVRVHKSMTVAEDWNCGDGLVWQFNAQLGPDHPLVVGAAAAAQGPQEALEAAERDRDAAARAWMQRHFPHPDFLNTVRELEFEWISRPEYWPGDPMRDTTELLEAARARLVEED